MHDSDEFLALGVDEFLAGPGLILIEWADRVDDALPRERWKVDIIVTGETTRRFDFSCRSDQDRTAFDSLMARMSEPAGNADR